MRYFLFTILLVVPLLLTAQSKKEQIATLNYKKDSLNLVIQNDRQDYQRNIDSLNLVVQTDRQNCKRNMDSLNLVVQTDRQNCKRNIDSLNLVVQNDRQDCKRNIDSLNLVVQTDRQNCNQNMDSLKTIHIVDKEKLQTEIQSIKDSLNILKNEIYMVSEEIAVLGDSIMLQKNIIFEFEFQMAPNGMFQYEAEYGYEYDVHKITEGSNQEGKDVTKDYCDCMNYIIQMMIDKDDWEGAYGIDGENEMTEDELKLPRAKQILLYWDLEECSLFNEPDIFDVFFSPEAKALNESSNIYFKD
jgi:hypothetical protein